VQRKGVNKETSNNNHLINYERFWWFSLNTGKVMGHIQVKLVSNILMKLFSNLVHQHISSNKFKSTKLGNQLSPLQGVLFKFLQGATLEQSETPRVKLLFTWTQDKKSTWQENILFNVIDGHTCDFMHLMVHSSIHIQPAIHANMEVVQKFRHDSISFCSWLPNIF